MVSRPARLRPSNAGLSEFIPGWILPTRLAWRQLRIHRKPCGLLNVEGYYDGLLAMLDHAVAEGFLRSENRGLIVSDSVPGRLIELLLGC